VNEDTFERIYSRTSQCGICDGRSDRETVFFSVRTTVFPCHHNSTNALYSITHLSPLLYNLLKLQNNTKKTGFSGLSGLTSYHADMAYHAPLFSRSIRFLLLAQRLN